MAALKDDIKQRTQARVEERVVLQKIKDACGKLIASVEKLQKIQLALTELAAPVDQNLSKLMSSLAYLETLAGTIIKQNKKEELADTAAKEIDESVRLIDGIVSELANIHLEHKRKMEDFKKWESFAIINKQGLTPEMLELLKRYEMMRDFHFFYILEDTANLIKSLQLLRKNLEGGLVHEGRIWEGYKLIGDPYRKHLSEQFNVLFKILSSIGNELKDILDETNKFRTSVSQA